MQGSDAATNAFHVLVAFAIHGFPSQRMSQLAFDWLAVDAVAREPCSAANSLLTGKNTGDFVCFDDSNHARILGNPHPEPISGHHPVFSANSEQGINRAAYQGIERGVTGKEQGTAFGWAAHRGA